MACLSSSGKLTPKTRFSHSWGFCTGEKVDWIEFKKKKDQQLSLKLSAYQDQCLGTGAVGPAQEKLPQLRLGISYSGIYFKRETFPALESWS